MTLAISIALLAVVASANHCRWKNALLWDNNRAGAADWPALVTSDNLYTVHIGHGVSSVDRNTGAENWFLEDADFVGACSEAKAGLIICPKKDSVVTIDAATGTVKKSREVRGTPSKYGAPLVVVGFAFFGTTEGLVYAVDVESMDEIWSTDLASGPIVSAPVPWGSNVVVGTCDGSVFQLRRTLGTTISSFAANVAKGHGVFSQIAIYGSTAYVNLNNQENNFLAIDLNHMTQTWVATPASGFVATVSPVVDVANSAVYIVTENGQVTGLDMLTGAVNWQHQGNHDARVRGPLAVIEGNLVAFASSTGFFIGYDFHTKAQAFSLRMEKGGLNSVPAVDGTSAYFAGSTILYEMNAICEMRTRR